MFGVERVAVQSMQKANKALPSNAHRQDIIQIRRFASEIMHLLLKADEPMTKKEVCHQRLLSVVHQLDAYVKERTSNNWTLPVKHGDTYVKEPSNIDMLQ